MVTLDRIRLTGLLRKKPWKRGFFYGYRFAGDSSGSPRGGLTAVSVEPPGAVARRGLVGRAGYEPLRIADANTREQLLLAKELRRMGRNRTRVRRARRLAVSRIKNAVSAPPSALTASLWYGRLG